MDITEKLVRDKIPQIVSAEGKTAEFRVADTKEMLHLLQVKLQEEVEEYLSSNDFNELADIEEVLRCLWRVHGIKEYDSSVSVHTRQKIVDMKRQNRGSFDSRYVLIKRGVAQPV